ncbi:protein zwilch [Caerostris extrusa]|uniref:Protein zwilch n=1 Tax=Caerostris extrusa TaxID=172846 RepID=A0AAV4SKV2_CAEEX|nr:protein zwilch [Caerostris extrusa]
MSETESHSDEVFSENTESASLQFDSLLKFSSGSSFGENCILYPLSQNIGRKLLLMCNSIEIETLKKLPILAICHDQHPKPSVYIGSWKHNNNARFYIKNQGAVSIQAQLPRLSVLKEVHLKGFPQSVLNIEISVLAHYDFLLKRFDDHILKPVRDSNVFVECTWSNSLSILEPLTDECLCLAKIKSVIGNEYSGAFSMYKELKLVEALQQSLKTGMITWRNSKINSNVLQNIGELICRENEIILKRNHPSAPFVPLKKSDEDEKFLFSFEQSVIRGRANLDFTDKLWNVLKECSSTEELMEAITLVYHSLEDFISEKKRSKIAVDIKKMKETLVLCPNLDPKIAFELLLEIGIEKLRRDYVELFLHLELVPRDYLNFYQEPVLLSLDAITCLKKLHSALELAIVCMKHLRFSKSLLSTFMRNILGYYATVPDIDLQHIFDFQIPTRRARKLLDQMRPSVWELSLTSCVNGFMKQSVHHYETTRTEDHIYAPSDYDPKLLLKTASYAYITAIFIQDANLQDKHSTV